MSPRAFLLVALALAGGLGWGLVRWTSGGTSDAGQDHVAPPAPGGAHPAGYAPEPAALAPGARESAAAADPAAVAPPAGAARGPHGRIALGDGRGVGAVRVALLATGAAEPVAVAPTDGRGVFEFPGRARGTRLRVSPDPRYSFEPVELALTAAQRAGTAPAEILARLSERTPLVGVLRDATTDEPVPEFKLWFWDSIGTDEWVVTDAEGRFETRDVFGTGRLVASLIDFEGSFGRYGRVELERARPFDEVVVPVELGPTYRLAFTPPPGYPPSEFFAEVRGHRRTARYYPYFFMRSRVRAGDPCWVRLHAGEVTEGPGPPWYLTLVSDDGLWAGSVPVDQRVGIHPGVLPIEVRPTGALRARVRDDAGEALSVQFHLRAEADGFQDWVRSNQDGELRYRGLPAGTVELSVSTPDYVPYSRSLPVEAGRELVFDVELTRRPPAGDVRGELHLQELASIPKAWIRAQGPDGLWRTGALEPVAGPLTRLEFMLPDLPAGTWRIGTTLADQGFEVEPREFLVEPPAEGLIFRVHAAAAPVPLRLDVRGGGGEVLEENLVLYGVAGGETCSCEDAFLDEPLFEAYVPGRPLRVVALAPGHAPWRGDESNFERVDGALVGRAALAPGWGAQFALVDSAGAPIPGVRLWVDGEATAPSDPEGGILVGASAPPSRLELDDDAWVLSASNTAVEAESGRFEPQGLWMRILLEPRR